MINEGLISRIRRLGPRNLARSWIHWELLLDSRWILKWIKEERSKYSCQGNVFVEETCVDEKRTRDVESCLERSIPFIEYNTIVFIHSSYLISPITTKFEFFPTIRRSSDKINKFDNNIRLFVARTKYYNSSLGSLFVNCRVLYKTTEGCLYF